MERSNNCSRIRGRFSSVGCICGETRKERSYCEQVRAKVAIVSRRGKTLRNPLLYELYTYDIGMRVVEVEKQAATKDKGSITLRVIISFTVSEKELIDFHKTAGPLFDSHIISNIPKVAIEVALAKYNYSEVQDKLESGEVVEAIKNSAASSRWHVQ
eukprot:TRINITY_DN5203_c0_g1_i1.p1 TRINITY_DN5203_c0_g1~~TRINITY_DN5203_c0_g1_i1.p1  ORF type:complete len:157 (-),score=14.14 TRINITY_DN5203_c0_g1_i1:128-598(-)